MTSSRHCGKCLYRRVCPDNWKYHLMLMAPPLPTKRAVPFKSLFAILAASLQSVCSPGLLRSPQAGKLLSSSYPRAIFSINTIPIFLKNRHLRHRTSEWNRHRYCRWNNCVNRYCCEEKLRVEENCFNTGV